MQNLRLGLKEKTFTLDVAFRLKKLLEQDGYKVVMTRVTDRQLAPGKEADLRMRDELANLAHADLFISIHFNATPPPDVKTHGTEVFTFPAAFQRSTDSWSSHLDDAEQFTSPANRNDDWNVVFAHAMHQELLRSLATEDRGEKIAHWGVLRALNCPGILIESAFLTNDAEARRVEDPAFRQRIAEAMLAGIRAYSAELDALSPPAPPK
jgi:N-acetylmuramoyl-L-alanine amidase